MAKPDAALLDPARFTFTHDITTRFADLDPNGHINNVAMAAVFEDGRVRFIQGAGFREALGDRRFMVVSVGIDYLAQAHFPHPLTCHTAALAVGTSSWTVQQLVLQSGAPVATARTTVVCTDGQRPVPLTDTLRALLAPWLMK
jgi:acyl-CoA thioester hydrolase